MLVIVTILHLIGIFTMSSIHINHAKIHFLRGILGLCITYGISRIQPQFWFKHSITFYLLNISSLILVFLIRSINGAHRWLKFASITIQPSELSKICIILFISYYIHTNELKNKFDQQLEIFLCSIFTLLLIIKQPDLGTATVIILIILSLIYLAKIISLTQISIISCITLSITPIIWSKLHNYQKDRILIFINPNSDSRGKGFHIQQALTAVGSGGIYGKGWKCGTQAKYGFLPECCTDSIFAHFAEEFGIIGCILILILYIMLYFSIIYRFTFMKIRFYQIMTCGIANYILIQALLNISMIIGLCPIVGIPLPFISYGGSSILSLYIALGIIESIRIHGEKAIVSSR